MKFLIAALLVAFVAAEQKREAEPSYGVAVGHHYGYGPAVARSYVRSYNHGIYKREAEADPVYGIPSYGQRPAIAYHPYGGRSFVHSNTHLIHKREAEAEAEPGYGLPSNRYGVRHGYGYGPGTAYHPYGGRSFVHSNTHLIHKREAEAEPGYGLPPYGYGSAIAYHPYGGRSFVHSNTHLIHKREADAEPGYLSPAYGHGAVYGYSSSVVHPGYGQSYQHNHVVSSHY